MISMAKGPPNIVFHTTTTAATTARPVTQLFLSSPRLIAVAHFSTHSRRPPNSRKPIHLQPKISPRRRQHKVSPKQPFRFSPNHHDPKTSPKQPQPLPQHQQRQNPQPQQQQRYMAFAVESFHRNERLKALISKLQMEEGSDPVRLLFSSDERDWSSEEFWTVISFLHQSSRFKDAVSVFNAWKNLEKSRINEANYSKVIELLHKSGMMEEAVSLLQEMKAYGLAPSVAIYNSIIHGFAEKRDFDTAKNFLKEMLENDLKAESGTYNGLIRAYGNHRMYDEMCKCVKQMEMEGLFPDHITYNILITAFAQGGLLEKMEGTHRTLLSKRMGLQSTTSIAMLEAYTNLGILEKMEKVYQRLLNLKVHLKEALIRKMALAYIESYKFSRLECLGLNTASRMGRTYLVWCLLLLSSACLLSRKGMESVLQEMKVAKVRPHVTFSNIIALAYLKMKDFRHLEILLSQLHMQNVKPDIVTIAVAFDANMSGFGETSALEVWGRTGQLEEEVEMKTDPLVLAAFGKGYFLRSCEELYTSLGSEAREKKFWTYNDLIDLVSKNNERK